MLQPITGRMVSLVLRDNVVSGILRGFIKFGCLSGQPIQFAQLDGFLSEMSRAINSITAGNAYQFTNIGHCCTYFLLLSTSFNIASSQSLTIMASIMLCRRAGRSRITISLPLLPRCYPVPFTVTFGEVGLRSETGCQSNMHDSQSGLG